MKTFKQFIKENYTSLTEQNREPGPLTRAYERIFGGGTGGTGGTKHFSIRRDTSLGRGLPPRTPGAKGVLPRITGIFFPPPPNQILDPNKYGTQFKKPEESPQSNFKDVNFINTANELNRASKFAGRFAPHETVLTPDTSKFVSTQKPNNIMRTDNEIYGQLKRSGTGQPNVTPGGGRFVNNIPPVAREYDPNNPPTVRNITGAILNSKNPPPAPAPGTPPAAPGVDRWAQPQLSPAQSTVPTAPAPTAPAQSTVPTEERPLTVLRRGQTPPASTTQPETPGTPPAAPATPAPAQQAPEPTAPAPAQPASRATPVQRSSYERPSRNDDERPAKSLKSWRDEAFGYSGGGSDETGETRWTNKGQ